jgi:hypothetical protein
MADLNSGCASKDYFTALLFFAGEVAVIDEIQMIRDTQRGWAWTRAFLGMSLAICIVCFQSIVAGHIQ